MLGFSLAAACDGGLQGAAAAPAPNWFTDEAGRFEREFTVAGPGDHDFWMTITKDGFEPELEPVWSGDGAPDDPVRMRVTLRPTP